MPKNLPLVKRMFIMPCIMKANATVTAPQNDINSPLRNIDVAVARAFVATAETGSMTAAARLLNLTQGAISQQIKRFEDLLGKSLFEREHRHLILSAEGERLMMHARRLIALNDEIWSLMSAPEVEGVVRLGVPHDIVRAFMPPILRSFNDAWPKVRIDLVCETSPDLKTLLADGEIDLTLTTEADTPAHAERLLSEDLVWIGSQNGRALKENPLPVAINCPKCTFRAAMVEALERDGRDWRMIGPVGNNDTLFATLEADLAVTSSLRATVPSHIDILGPETGLPPLRPFHVNLYVRASNPDIPQQELASHIRDQFHRRYARPVPLRHTG